MKLLKSLWALIQKRSQFIKLPMGRSNERRCVASDLIIREWNTPEENAALDYLNDKPRI